jgi:hypothetical protein
MTTAPMGEMTPVTAGLRCATIVMVAPLPAKAIYHHPRDCEYHALYLNQWRIFFMMSINDVVHLINEPLFCSTYEDVIAMIMTSSLRVKDFGS